MLSEHFRIVSIDWLIVLGFNDTSTLVGHFVSSPREREKRDRWDSRRDVVEKMKERNREERGTGMKVKKQKKYTPPPPPFPSSTFTCYKDSRLCPTVSKYQLDAPVTSDTRYLRHTRPPPWGNSNEYASLTLFMIKLEKLPKISLNICFLELLKELPRDSKPSYGIRAIGVRVIEVLLYYSLICCLLNFVFVTVLIRAHAELTILRRLSILNSFTATGDNNIFFANSVDPDETAHNEPSHQDIRCLTFRLSALPKNFLPIDSLLKKIVWNLAPKELRGTDTLSEFATLPK